MLVIWSGWGILVLPIVVGTSVVVGGAIQVALVAAGLERLSFLAFSLGLFAAAAACWLIGKRFNAGPGRELVDPRTGERVVLRRLHRLFWVRMEYWAIPVAVAALVPLLAIPSLFR